jgi:DNA-binding NtrC family response regulator
MKILVIDDEENQRNILSDILIDAGFTVATAAGGEEGLERIFQEDFLLILTDLKLPGIDGIEVLKTVMTYDPEIQVVLMTAYGTIPSAVSAIKMGAYDYLTKPFNKEDLLMVVRRAADKVRLIQENRRLRDRDSDQFSYQNLIGRSDAMRHIFTLIEKVKDIDATVIITGESGTGKELVARAIHDAGKRKSGPFIAVNCGAIPENLIESELFGFEKGAFTGATRKHSGKFEQAQQGTLFLDEISVMPLHLQTRLLRVLQDKKVAKIGSSQAVDLDIRIIAATNENLEKMVEQELFRLDLFHRLNIFSISLPALRERPQDIPLLAQNFLEKFARIYRKKNLKLSPSALKCLENYALPGNVRELENIIEKAVILCDKESIEAESLMLNEEKQTVSQYNSKISSNLPEMEVELIKKALLENNGSLKKAAHKLGITYKTLQYRMKKHGLNRKDFK